MITAAIVGMLAGLASLVFLAVPDIPVPGWLTDQSGAWGALLHGAAALNQFVPLGTAIAILGAVVASFGIGVVIRLTRMIISHVTGGGGST